MCAGARSCVNAQVGQQRRVKNVRAQEKKAKWKQKSRKSIYQGEYVDVCGQVFNIDHDRSLMRFVFQEKLNEDASDENVMVRIGQGGMW